MPRFRRIPTEIEAFQFQGCTGELVEWAHKYGDQGMVFFPFPRVDVLTEQGQWVSVRVGEWIIPDQSHGRFYPVADEVFQKLYQPVD